MEPFVSKVYRRDLHQPRDLIRRCLMRSLFGFLTWSVAKSSRPPSAYRPVLEMLEGRALPSVDVNMLFATTSDSHHVTFNYQIVDHAPFHVTIYRSADTAVDGSDVPLGTFPINPTADG